MNVKIKIKVTLAAVKVLKKEIGMKALLKVAPNLSKRAKNGEPYNALPSPETKKDKDSRELIADAILLYRELVLILPQAKAEAIIREVIKEAAIAQLRCLIPTLKGADLRQMTVKDRTNRYCEIVDKFPNTDWTVTKDTEDEVSISMCRCRLVEIFEQVGHPELRDSCCAGDAIYFERHQPDIDFKREHMIGKGDPECDFNFKLK